jgi:hypothetical protein
MAAEVQELVTPSLAQIASELEARIEEVRARASTILARATAPDLRAHVAELGAAVDALSASGAALGSATTDDAKRVDEILEVIYGLAQLDFSRRAALVGDGPIDALAASANMLAEELETLGCTDVKAAVAGVAFTGTLAAGYRACLWSRLASRVLLSLASFPAATQEALYEGVHGLPWEEHLSAAETLAVDAASSRSALAHTHFIALKVKDAIVDRLRERTGTRPSV